MFLIRCIEWIETEIMDKREPYRFYEVVLTPYDGNGGY
jgi:hypothetical protein